MERLVCAGKTKVLASAEPRSQVFERFVRLEEHRDFNQADGAGLGLARVGLDARHGRQH